jgi:hypothetical protein
LSTVSLTTTVIRNLISIVFTTCSVYVLAGEMLTVLPLF